MDAGTLFVPRCSNALLGATRSLAVGLQLLKDGQTINNLPMTADAFIVEVVQGDARHRKCLPGWRESGNFALVCSAPAPSGNDRRSFLDKMLYVKALVWNRSAGDTNALGESSYIQFLAMPSIAWIVVDPITWGKVLADRV
jgi:hypothetical protein